MIASSGGGIAGGVIYLLMIGALYFIPTGIVLLRKRPNPGPTIVVNALLGWTFIGWVVALAMSLQTPRPAQTIVVQGTQPPVPAGWYPDPDDRTHSRWWDGSRWADPS